MSGYLLTPVLNPTNDAEERYNSSHKCTRQVIERAFGVAKIRFRCIHKSGGELTYDPLKCCKIIVTCSILHNMCVEANLPIDVDDEDDDGDENGLNCVINRQVHGNGANVRRQLIQQRFQRH